MYKPKFTKTERDGKIALWVEMPTGESYKIWDLTDGELTASVEKAIISAFNRGVKAVELHVMKSFNNIHNCNLAGFRKENEC